MSSPGVQFAEQLMGDFAARTGLHDGGQPARRYLWTDAFAVFALTGLWRRTGKHEYIDWLLSLVDLVHRTLGRHRPGDPRQGWISGRPESDGERHPTAGGLRIGKPLPERDLTEMFDEGLEWERDGQYFHYLTKWMLALNRASRVTGDPRFHEWAVELADVAHRAFVYQPRWGGPKRMYWKMSVDLSRPVMPSMGHLDPLDGYVTFADLASHREPNGRHATSRSVLAGEIDDLRRMCDSIPSWRTRDSLGIGALLTEAAQLVRLIAAGEAEHDDLLPRLLLDTHRSLQDFDVNELALPADSRLAFRELGMCIGLRCIDSMRSALNRRPERFGGANSAAGLLAHVDSLSGFLPLAQSIETFWLAADTAGASWSAHLDINSVMLATSLVPDAYTRVDELGSIGAAAGPPAHP